jgi:hypothetical protein
MPEPIPLSVITRTTAGLVLATASATDGAETVGAGVVVTVTVGVGLVELVMLGFEHPATPTRRVKKAMLMQSAFISPAF